eukprot:PLAT7680.1.p1 GENE.PLAT7680.1~~PLAT7680.1.p1  ORF type:complete len:1191 (+),score=523.30 PLAT7680.1:507-3575(+)
MEEEDAHSGEIERRNRLRRKEAADWAAEKAEREEARRLAAELAEAEKEDGMQWQLQQVVSFRRAKVSEGKVVRHYRMDGTAVTAMCLCERGGYMLVGTAGGLLATWDLSSNSKTHEWQGHGDRVCGARGLFYYARAITAGADCAVHMWDVRSGEKLMSFAGHTDVVNCLDVSLKAKWLATGGYDTVLRVFRMSTGKQVMQTKAHADLIAAVALSSDTNNVVTAGGPAEPRLIVWDREWGRKLRELRVAGGPDTAHVGWINAVGFLPDGTLMSASSDGTLRAWSLWSGDCVRSRRETRGYLTNFTLTQDQQHILACTSVGEIVTLSVDGWKEELRFAGHRDVVWCALYHPNGRFIYSCSEDGDIINWRISETAPDVIAPAPRVSNVTSSSMRLSWEEPACNGLPITAYRIMRRVNSRRRFRKFKVVHSNSVNIKGLTPGTFYEFKVSAVNDIGAAPFSQASEKRRTRAAVPLAVPQPLAMEVRSRSVFVRWEIPDCRGSDAQRFHVQVRRGVDGSWGEPTAVLEMSEVTTEARKAERRLPRERKTGTVYVKRIVHYTNAVGEVPGLQPATEYQLRVATENRVGVGDFSLPTFPVVTRPAAPGDVSELRLVKRTAETVTLAWTAAFPFGEPVTKHRLRVRLYATPAGAIAEDAKVEEERKRITAASPSRRRRSSARLAGIGSTLVLDAADRFVSVWDVMDRGPETETQLVGLRAGHTYDVQVAAVNSVGDGGWSENARFTTRVAPPPPPDPPRLAVVEAVDRLKVSWMPLKADNGTAVLGFVLRVTKSDAVGLAREFRKKVHELRRGAGGRFLFVIDELQAATAYEICVAACNEEGPGDFSAPFLYTSPAGQPPGPVSELAVVDTQPVSCKVVWKQPRLTGGGVRSAYALRITRVGAEEHVREREVDAKATEWLFDRLTSRASYVLEVAAVTQFGRGEFTAVHAKLPSRAEFILQQMAADSAAAAEDKAGKKSTFKSKMKVTAGSGGRGGGGSGGGGGHAAPAVRVGGDGDAGTARWRLPVLKS